MQTQEKKLDIAYILDIFDNKTQEEIIDICRDMIKGIIERAPLPRKRKLECLQFKIEQELKRHKTIEARLNAAFTMMWDSHLMLDDAWHGKLPTRKIYNAEIIPLFSKK